MTARTDLTPEEVRKYLADRNQIAVTREAWEDVRRIKAATTEKASPDKFAERVRQELWSRFGGTLSPSEHAMILETVLAARGQE